MYIELIASLKHIDGHKNMMLAAWMFVAICPIMQEFISLHSAIL